MQPTAPEKWYQKKRYWLLGLVLFIFGMGVLGASAPVSPTVYPEPTAVVAPSEPASDATQASTYQAAPTLQAQPQSTQTQDSGLSNDNYYTNSDGNEVHSPAYPDSNTAPDGATAECGDGTYSFSQHRSGTCSHHGGVAEWLN